MRKMRDTSAGNRIARIIIRATQRRGASVDGFLGGEGVEEEEEGGGERRLVLVWSWDESSSSIFCSVGSSSEYLLQNFQSIATRVGDMLRTEREKQS